MAAVELGSNAAGLPGDGRKCPEDVHGEVESGTSVLRLLAAGCGRGSAICCLEREGNGNVAFVREAARDALHKLGKRHCLIVVAPRGNRARVRNRERGI